MNYAADRLDRAGRDRAGVRGLRRDRRDALAAARRSGGGGRHHAALARALCAAGWNRHAAHHYGAALDRALEEREAAAGQGRRGYASEGGFDDDDALLERLGDYVQMAELAGWPEVSVVALLAFRWHRFKQGRRPGDDEGEADAPPPAEKGGGIGSSCRGGCESSEGGDATGSDSDEGGGDGGGGQPAWPDGDRAGDCGCGSRECGRAPCYFPAALRPLVPRVLRALDRFLDATGADRPPPPMPWSAHEIQRRVAVRAPLDAVHRWNRSALPRDLRAALGLVRKAGRDGDEDSHRSDDDEELDLPLDEAGASSERRGPIQIALRMLLVKLLYLTVPALACAVLAADAGEEAAAGGEGPAPALGPGYKSHAAFDAFVRSLALGDRRVKPSRRHSVPYYHVPVWDLLHGIDRRSDYYYCLPPDPVESVPGAARTTNDAPRVCRTITDREADGENELPSLAGPLCRPLLSEQWDELLKEATAAEPKDEGPTAPSDNRPLFPITYFVPRPAGRAQPPPLYVVGDSHVLSLAWQTVRLPVPTASNGRWAEFVVVPVLVTGLKAGHCGKDVRFFTHTRLADGLRRLRAAGCATIAFSAGEIDCREGLGGPALAGYAKPCLDLVPAAVGRYLSSLREMLDGGGAPGLRQILVLPVAPHALQATSRSAGQASRRDTVRAWNVELRNRLPSSPPGLFLLDYVDRLLAAGRDDAAPSQPTYVLRGDLAADSTHLSAAFARHFESAIVASGCDLSLLP